MFFIYVFNVFYKSEKKHVFMFFLFANYCFLSSMSWAILHDLCRFSIKTLTYHYIRAPLFSEL